MKTIVIIGAGPAGIAAAIAAATNAKEKVNVILIEAGNGDEFRDHDDAIDLNSGLGGAGLFSDGKFSFFPSGTEVYRLKDLVKINKGYEWMKTMFSEFSIFIPPNSLQDMKSSTSPAISSGGKKYPSLKTTLGQRQKMIAYLKQKLNGSILTNTRVNVVEKTNDRRYVVRTNNGTFFAHIVIFATGKLGVLNIPTILQPGVMKKSNVNLRYEFGVRVESRSDIGFLNRTRQLDVKRLWNVNGIQVRTFCTCRKGQIWCMPNSNISAVSGRSEEAKESKYSNFGLLLRFTGKNFECGDKIWQEIRKLSLVAKKQVMWQTLPSFLSKDEKTSGVVKKEARPWFPQNNFVNGKVHEVISKDFYDLLKAALEELIKYSPDLNHDETVIIFPAIEGVGAYLQLDDNLQLEDELIWCAGDMVGKFRGLVPSLLSGFYAGLCAAEALMPPQHLPHIDTPVPNQPLIRAKL